MPPVQLHIVASDAAAVLHAIDALSRWHPCAHSPSVDEAECLSLDLSEEDRTALASYAAARQELGWDAEIDLLAWADQGFPENEPFAQIWGSIEPLLTDTSLTTAVAGRQQTVRNRLPAVEAAIQDMGPHLAEFDHMVTLLNWRGRKAWQDYPIFLFFAFHPTSLKGGANGEGVFAELHPDPKELQRTLSTLLHEVLHKILNPREVIRAHLEHRQEELRRLLFVDPHGQQKDELAILDETLIHSLSPRRFLSLDPANESRRARDGGQHTYARIWDFVARSASLVDDALAGKLRREEFLDALVAAFLREGHVSVWHE